MMHTKIYHNLKKKQILLYATTWMNFEDIMLNEISVTDTPGFCLYEVSKIIKLKEGESRMVQFS